MVLECVKTCVIHASEMVASYDKARVVTLLRECIDFEGLSAIQFCPRGLIRVTFKNASDKEEFVRVGSLTLDGHDLSVTSSDMPHSLVYVHYFPAEGDDALIRDELGKYGDVISIKHQSFSRIPGLLTGSRILTMVLSDPVPAEFRIDDYPVRVWYKGIPPFCQICKASGHKAADCQFNGKCRRCGSPDHKAHACVRPWGQSAVPMEAAVPEVVPDPSGAVVPVISDSSADLDKGVDGVFEDAVVENEVADEDADDEDADVEDEVPVSTPVGVPVPSSVNAPVAVGPAPSVPVVTKEVQAPAVSVGSSGSPVRSSGWGWGTPSPSCVAASVSATLDDRRKVSEWYLDELCHCSKDEAFVLSYRDMRVSEVFPSWFLEVLIVLVNGARLRVHPNVLRITKVDTSGEQSEVEFAQYILKVMEDPSFWIGFRGSLVDKIGPTMHDNVLCVEFEDLSGPQSRRLPAKALWVKKAPVSNNASTNVDNSVINIVNDSVTKSRSVVPTAAVLAAELLKRAAPTSTVGVPKCSKKL
ncbi:hypothetical protein pdam_00019618 [Pocillopora damicornis]|uniref:CCHC-type domain-containing protein n=1 Tax=Pocillopora damicornis TaxID=46731 RepID=A0A3M6TKG9_POCDA|nr:hypothetical protein pdam_00019618 [Pocillopora damicornis]